MSNQRGSLRLQSLAILIGFITPMFADADDAARPRTTNMRIVPRWSDAEHFQFERELASGMRETIAVDAATGELIVLARYEPDARPQSGKLLAGPAPASLSSDDETFLTFVNRSGRKLTLSWIDPGGNAIGYGTVSPGKSRRQHTFVTHAWQVTDDQGNFYGSLVAPRSSIEVHIEKPLGTVQPSRQRPGRRESPKDAPSPSPQMNGHSLSWNRDSGLNEIPITVNVPLRNDGVETRLVRTERSPDGSVVVVWRMTPGENKEVFTIDSSPEDGGRATLHRHVYPLPGDRLDAFELFVFEAFTGDAISFELPIMDFGTPRIHWFDGHKIAIEKVDRGHQRFRLLVVDPIERSLRTIIDETSDTFLWTNHGPQVPTITFLESRDEVIYASERSGWRHLYLVDLQGERPMRAITHGDWVVRKIVHVDELTRQLDLMVGGFHPDQDPYHQHLVRVDFKGRELIPLTQGNGDHQIQISPDRQFFIDSYSRVDLPPVHELRRMSDGKRLAILATAERLVGSANASPLPEAFVAKGRDDQTDIWGMICLPPGFDASTANRYPIIEDIYAGPHGSHVPKRYSDHAWYEELTSLGFVVVKVDGMGTANRSKAFHDVCWHNLRDAGFPDRIKWINAAAKKHPALDISRVGIYGTSAGGQNACGALLFHGDFYRAAVASCGCHDNRMDKASWNEQWMGYPVGEQYARSSNIEHAANLTGKLMLIVGELDENVPPESTLRLVDALIRKKKTFEFLLIPGMGHSDGGTYGRQRMHEFFVETLRPTPAN